MRPRIEKATSPLVRVSFFRAHCLFSKVLLHSFTKKQGIHQSSSVSAGLLPTFPKTNTVVGIVWSFVSLVPNKLSLLESCLYCGSRVCFKFGIFGTKRTIAWGQINLQHLCSLFQAFRWVYDHLATKKSTRHHIITLQQLTLFTYLGLLLLSQAQI